MATDSTDFIDILSGGNEAAKPTDSQDAYTDILPPPPPSPSNPASNPQAGSFSFSGRARRLDYWRMMIEVLLLCVVLAVICGATAFEGGLVVLLLLVIPLAIWACAVSVRRCHDIGWSGLVVLVCFLLPAFVIVLGIFDGQPFANKYGPDPKGRNLNGGQPHQAPLGDQLRELKKLLDDGILTQEEFDAQKAKILAGNSATN